MTPAEAIIVVAGNGQAAQNAANAWTQDATQLDALGANTANRQAALIGQCAHESALFRHRFENLNYSGAGLWKTFGSRHFRDKAEADSFARQPERIANRVYSDRMGNGTEASGDGWRYRGRGFLQLTGKDNYRIYGGLLSLDLVGDPEQAARPEICWRIAAQFLARVRRSGKTLFQWADLENTEMVTLGINGGRNGLAHRELMTAKALHALTGNASTAEWQSLLLSAGFNPGPIDGLMGPKTRDAIKAAEDHFGLTGAALLAKLRDIEGN